MSLILFWFKIMSNSEHIIEHLHQTQYIYCFVARLFFKGQKAVRNSENVFILRGKWLMAKGLTNQKWEVGEMVLGARKNI